MMMGDCYLSMLHVVWGGGYLGSEVSAWCLEARQVSGSLAEG